MKRFKRVDLSEWVFFFYKNKKGSIPRVCKKSSILWVTSKRKRVNSLILFSKGKVQFLASFFEEVRLLESFFLGRGGSILRVIKKRSIYSLSHTLKNILWIILKKNSHFLWLMLKRKVQSLWVIFFKNGSILWVIWKSSKGLDS